VHGQPKQDKAAEHFARANMERPPMSSWLKSLTSASFVIAGLTTCSCLAAGDLISEQPNEDVQEHSWSREQKLPTRPDPVTIVQQKAQIRAQQRNERMATASWYGMSMSRPSGASTPFTSRYGSVWEMPGGRPYSWYPAYARPTYVFYPWW
jgi:hypothetical protein